MNNTYNIYIYILSIVGILLTVTIFLEQSEDSVQVLDHTEYCEIIQINKDTNGEYGWPDDGRDCDQ